MTNYLFPLSFAINTFSITGLMILLGLSGKSELAADFGIVQGSTMALFFAFSANARNLILNQNSTISSSLLLRKRLLLTVPLGAASYGLSAVLAGVNPLIAFILITRRCIEWLAEIYLSTVESKDNHYAAIKFIVIQLLLLGIVLLWNLFQIPYQWVGILCWALLPICFFFSFIVDNIKCKIRLFSHLKKISPHFGSSTITGITVYVFRLLLLLLAGRALAGDLFTAFAIGGVISTIFANVLGPSLAYQNRVKRKIVLPRWLKISLWVSLVSGLLLFGAAETEKHFLTITHKSFFFWSATGLSMIGGPLMVLAQRQRLKILQFQSDNDVFGPDLVINLLMIIFIPFIFYGLGVDILKTLFLYNSVIALIFYSSFSENRDNKKRFFFSPKAKESVKTAIALALVMPFFFQLNGNVFADPSCTYNSGGILTRLPIPISVPACLLSLFLISAYTRARPAINTIFFFFISMLLATIISTNGCIGAEKGKLILMFQFLLPMFALALGQMFERKSDTPPLFEKASLFMLLLIVPCQILSTLLMKRTILSPYLYFFSIYQQLQYIPVIFASLYLICLFVLWGQPGFSKPLVFLGLLMGFYVIVSLSFLANFILVFGILCFAAHRWHKQNDKQAPALTALIIISLFFSIFYVRGDPTFLQKNGFIKKTVSQELLSEADIPSISTRLTYWKHYTANIFSSPKTFIVGHAQRPNRTEYPSAHNYYLDLIYNFGFLSFLPLAGLILFTMGKIYTYREKIIANPRLTGLTLIVLFLLLIDNSLKVGLRQPYPGIISFFLWGLLLTRLSPIASRNTV